MLDEQVEKARCIARLKDAFALGLHGNAVEVLEGRAEGVLKQKHAASGAGQVRSQEKEREERRKRSGDGSLDAFVTVKRIRG